MNNYEVLKRGKYGTLLVKETGEGGRLAGLCYYAYNENLHYIPINNSNILEYAKDEFYNLERIAKNKIKHN